MIFRVTANPELLDQAYEVRAFWNVPPNDTEFVSGRGVSGRGYLSGLTATSVDLKDGPVLIPPFLTLLRHQAQQLMDAMYDAGIRPTNGAGSVGQMDAVQKHLADMRTIAMAKLGLRIVP